MRSRPALPGRPSWVRSWRSLASDRSRQWHPGASSRQVRSRAVTPPPSSLFDGDPETRIPTWKKGTPKPCHARRNTPKSCSIAGPGWSSTPVAHVARDLGVHHETLRKWVRKTEADEGKCTELLSSQEREELAQLRKDKRERRQRLRRLEGVRLANAQPFHDGDRRVPRLRQARIPGQESGKPRAVSALRRAARQRGGHDGDRAPGPPATLRRQQRRSEGRRYFSAGEAQIRTAAPGSRRLAVERQGRVAPLS